MCPRTGRGKKKKERKKEKEKREGKKQARKEAPAGQRSAAPRHAPADQVGTGLQLVQLLVPGLGGGLAAGSHDAEGVGLGLAIRGQRLHRQQRRGGLVAGRVGHRDGRAGAHAKLAQRIAVAGSIAPAAGAALVQPHRLGLPVPPPGRSPAIAPGKDVFDAFVRVELAGY